MNKILRYSFIAMLAFICNVSFADTVVTFTAGTENGSFDASKPGADKITKEGVTIETSNGAFAASNQGTGNSEYRIYKSSTFTATVAEGNIKKIVFTCTANGTTKYGPGCFTGEGYTYEESGEFGTWEGNATSVTLTASSNQVRATKIEVTIDANGQGGGETPTPPTEQTTKAENIAAFKALTSGTTAILALTNAQVLYKNVYTTKSGATNTEYYIRDASGAIQFFNTDLDLNVNQILNGTVEVKYSPYNDMPEAAKSTNTSAEKLTITDGEVAVPTKVTVADLSTDKYLCDLVTVENVKITTEEEGTFTNKYLVSGDDKVMFYDKFKTNVAITDGEGYNVTGILVTANLSGKIVKELAPISAPTSTGINSITADVDSAKDAPIFNLSGQRVGKNAKGVLIKNGKKYVVK